MKNLKINQFELYLLSTSLNWYKTEVLPKMDSKDSSIMTKEYIDLKIKELEEKINEQKKKWEHDTLQKL